MFLKPLIVVASVGGDAVVAGGLGQNCCTISSTIWSSFFSHAIFSSTFLIFRRFRPSVKIFSLRSEAYFVSYSSSSSSSISSLSLGEAIRYVSYENRENCVDIFTDYVNICDAAFLCFSIDITLLMSRLSLLNRSFVDFKGISMKKFPSESTLQSMKSFGFLSPDHVTNRFVATLSVSSIDS